MKTTQQRNQISSINYSRFLLTFIEANSLKFSVYNIEAYKNDKAESHEL